MTAVPQEQSLAASQRRNGSSAALSEWAGYRTALRLLRALGQARFHLSCFHPHCFKEELKALTLCISQGFNNAIQLP